MALDPKTVARVATLARIRVPDSDLAPLAEELSHIVSWIEQLDEVDTEGVGSYLETPRDDNVPYYRRFGYELVDTLQPIEGGPPYYTMWRAPR